MRVITNSQYEAERKASLVNHPVVKDNQQRFNGICEQVHQYCLYIKEQYPDVTATVAEFYKAAIEKTSAELREWALTKGLTESQIFEIAPSFLALLADAQRFGFGWEQIFQNLIKIDELSQQEQ